MTTAESTTVTDSIPSVTTNIAFSVPILSGMADAHREVMTAAAHGRTRDAHAASRQRAGISREVVWHQDTPDGSIAVVYLEADDVSAAMDRLGTSDDPYDRSFSEHVARTHGIDLSEEFPIPELRLGYVASTTDREAKPEVVGFAVPILPGKDAGVRSYLASVSQGDRTVDHAASRQRAGITGELVWHQRTPHGTVAVVYIEAADVEAAMGQLAASDEPFDREFRDQVRSVHGFDLEDGFPPPELIFDLSY